MAETRKKMPRPVAVSELLTASLHGKPAGKRLEEGRIWLVWDAAVGPQIAGKARPVGFRDGVLTVAVTSAPWMQQLAFLKPSMMDKINQRLGRELVRDIYLKAGTTPLPSPQSQPRSTPVRQLTEEEARRIKEQTAAISDPDLREAFTRVLARSLTSRTKIDP